VESMELMETAPGANPRPGRVPEQRILSPKIGFRWWRRYRTLSRKMSIDLKFSHRRLRARSAIDYSEKISRSASLLPWSGLPIDRSERGAFGSLRSASAWAASPFDAIEACFGLYDAGLDCATVN
jgi:hypothetical protein